jgi:protein TonB
VPSGRVLAGSQAGLKGEAHTEKAVDQIVTTRVDVPGPWRTSRRRRRRLGPVIVISLWLHLTVLLLLLVSVRYERREEELPPPSTVAMVFEGGKPEGPALPKPLLEIPAPVSPPAPPPAPVPVPRATVEPPKAPSPPQVAEPAPVPTPPLPLPPIPVPAPPPPPPLPPVALAVPRPVLPPPRTPPAPSPSQRPSAPAPSTAFPAPMNYSFNQAPLSRPSQPRTASRGLSTLDFSLAPRQGATDTSPFSRVAGAHVGPDWRNELSAWVRAHAYYPEQAAMNGEDGDVMVRVVANPDGRVTGVELRSKSGSVWLDMALVALFRDAHLPPLHDENEPITFDFLMHYILIRGR